METIRFRSSEFFAIENERFCHIPSDFHAYIIDTYKCMPEFIDVPLFALECINNKMNGNGKTELKQQKG